MTRRMPFVLVMLLVTAACGDSPTSPDGATTTAIVSPTVFEGTLELNASNFYSFTVSQPGSVTAYLASLTLVGRRDALAVPVRVGIGVPKGEGCAITQSVDTTPSLVTQLTMTLGAGIYCMDISDIGALPGAAVFTLRFRHS